jgi:TatD DNase family protein
MYCICRMIHHSRASMLCSIDSLRFLLPLLLVLLLVQKARAVALPGYSTTRRGMPSACPCCAFGDNLFLPAGVLTAAAAAEQPPPQSQHAPSTSSHDINGDGDDEELPLPSARQVWQALQPPVSNVIDHDFLRLFDSHGHAHLTRDDGDESDEPSLYDVSVSPPDDDNSSSIDAPSFASLSCAVAPADWTACLDFAAQSPRRVAALGVHPWYLPEIANGDETWLTALETQLQEHPGLAVGEIGLCKVARWVRTYEPGKAAALARQRHVMEQQLDLAAAYRRPVSLHCVQQQATLLEIFKSRSSRATTESDRRAALPPALALHSFSGTAHHVQQLLQWEASLSGQSPTRKKKKKIFPEEEAVEDGTRLSATASPLLYFGISHAVNYGMSSAKARRQARTAIQGIPPDRLLAESDVSGARGALGGTLLAVAYLAAVRQEPLAAVARQTTANALRFLQSLPQPAPGSSGTVLVDEKGLE